MPSPLDVSYTRKLPGLEELQARPQWVCWRKEKRQGKLTKVPYSATTGKRAETDNPATWASYAQAVQVQRARRYDGIGYVFHQDYTGIDLDHCVNADGSLDPWAQAYLERLGSYAEYSPSQTGIHILVRGTIQSGTRRQVPEASHPEAAIEMYCERRYFTVTGKQVAGTPDTIETCAELQAIHRELTAPKQPRASQQSLEPRPAGELPDEALIEKAMRAKNGATFRALWQGDTSGYPSQSEAELALCQLLAFWTGRDSQRMDRLFRRSALYRPEKWDRPARTGELYGEGTLALAIARCTETYHQTPAGKVIPFRRELAGSGNDDLANLPEAPRRLVLDCLRDEEEGDARLYAYLFRGRCIYDHTEKMWYEWQGHYWERDECKHALLLASGPLASAYLKTSAELSDEAAHAEQQLDPDLLKGHDAKAEHYQWLKAMTGKLIERAKALKKLRRAQAVLTYAQAYLSITSREWDTRPWLLGTREGVLDLQTGILRPGLPQEFIRTIIPTTWRGLDVAAPRFEQYLREIFADRPDAECEGLLAFLQRALGYGITGHVNEHIFLVLYGEEGRNGKDTLMTLLQYVLGRVVGAVSNDVIIATGKYTAPGSAKPHLCALQGKRIAWASETSRGARFDVGQVKFLTGGGDIPARQLYGQDYTFVPSHLLILLTNNKPHADAHDSAFWDRLCPIIFNIRFVDHPSAPNERQKDRTLGHTLEQEASGILAWLVRGCLVLRSLSGNRKNYAKVAQAGSTGCSFMLLHLTNAALAWQREGLHIPSAILQARREYREEEDTLGQFLKECCVLTNEARTQGKRLYDHYREWTVANNLKPMNGNAFGIEMKKRFSARREEKGWCYFGVGLQGDPLAPPLEGIQPGKRPSEAEGETLGRKTPVYPAFLSQKLPYRKGENLQEESFQGRYTGYTGEPSSDRDEVASQASGDSCIPAKGGIQESISPKEAETTSQALVDGCTRNEPGIQEVYSHDSLPTAAPTYTLGRWLKELDEIASYPHDALVDTPDGLGYVTGARREQDVTFVAPERQPYHRYNFGVQLLQDGEEHFYLAGTLWEVRVKDQVTHARNDEVSS